MEALKKATRAGNGHGIRQPAVNIDFEVKGQILNMITHQCQIRGTPKEDAFEHLQNFKSICNLFKVAQVEDTVIYLRVFPWSLKDDTKDWLESLPEGDIDSWTTMKDKFLLRFFPASKAAQLQSDINHFTHKPHETLYDAWTWFGPHLTKDCNQASMEEQVNYLGNQYNNQYQGGSSGYQRNGPPGFVNRNQNKSYVDKGPSLEELLQGFVIKTDESITALRQDSESTKQQVRSQQASIQNLERDVGHIAQSLTEGPSGALPSNTQANPNVNGPPRTILTNNNRSDMKNKVPQVPTYSHVNAFSGDEGYDFDEVIPTYTHNGVDSWIRVSDITLAYGNYLMSLMTGSSSSLGNQESKVKSVETTESPEFNVDEIKVEEEVKPSHKLKVYKPPIPYPRAIQSEQPKDTFCKSINSNENIYVHVPLVDVLAGMPNYGKFLKDLMAKKGEHEQASSAFLEAECAAILEKSDMPPKLGDPGPFIVPCRIDDSEIFRCLTDSGESINLMPLSVYSRLGLDELKSTNTGVRLINQSISKPIGIAENLVIKIGELEFPADFVVVDMPKDKVVPIVLGRPFLATAGALTEWRTCNLILRDSGKTLSFQTKFSVKPTPTPIDSVNVLTSETDNVKTKTSRKPKCRGGVIKEKPVVKLPDDSVVDRSMRRLFGRVKKAMNEKDEQLRLRLVSNLSKKEKVKLRELTRESSAADDWLLSIFGDGSVENGGSHVLHNVMTIEEWPSVQSHLSLRFAIILLYIRLCFSH
ncbi:uncharacterized protein [Rutidosis leptorrhynchoides]|uniref:uncharacterized protein n=1 Tax=Rutidosis leptorrhynchoides TaxID=125765 RepID=UPI003A9A52E8